jgi:hypothetical protein
MPIVSALKRLRKEDCELQVRYSETLSQKKEGKKKKKKKHCH